MVSGSREGSSLDTMLGVAGDADSGASAGSITGMRSGWIEDAGLGCVTASDISASLSLSVRTSLARTGGGPNALPALIRLATMPSTSDRVTAELPLSYVGAKLVRGP